MADQPAGYYSEAACDLADFAALTAQSTDPATVPHAIAVEKNIPLYDVAALGPQLADPGKRRALMAEWAAVLGSGPGVLVLRQAQSDHAAIDAATDVFNTIIAREKANGPGADHFAGAGANDRIWNSLQKLALAAPDTFARYHASPAIDAVCEAWLGPAYQMTAQVNLVHPGGRAQQAHRDYHLGFQTAARSAAYPAHVHDLSPLMTLQGGIAHCDMPVLSGPTKLLPFSQLYKPGYAAWRRADFRAHFEAHFVQLPLQKGDALFFNPALFHAAGDNDSADIARMVNLLQVSSPFGRAMESLDRTAMCKALFPALKAAALTPAQRQATIAACAEGYPFPTNLDTDPPAGGLAPQSQAELMAQALAEDWPTDRFTTALAAQEAKRRA